MQQIEDTPQQLVYYQDFKIRLTDKGKGLSEYRYLLMLSTVLVIVTLIASPRLPTIFSIIILGTLAAFDVFILAAFRDQWNIITREKWLIVDKSTHQLVRRYVSNDGSITEDSYTAAQIQGIIPDNTGNSYAIVLKITSQAGGQHRLMLELEWWEKQAERDAVLTKLQAALDLPVRVEDEASRKD